MKDRDKQASIKGSELQFFIDPWTQSLVQEWGKGVNNFATTVGATIEPHFVFLDDKRKVFTIDGSKITWTAKGNEGKTMRTRFLYVLPLQKKVIYNMGQTSYDIELSEVQKPPVFEKGELHVFQNIEGMQGETVFSRDYIDRQKFTFGDINGTPVTVINYNRDGSNARLQAQVGEQVIAQIEGAQVKYKVPGKDEFYIAKESADKTTRTKLVIGNRGISEYHSEGSLNSDSEFVFGYHQEDAVAFYKREGIEQSWTDVRNGVIVHDRLVIETTSDDKLIEYTTTIDKKGVAALTIVRTSPEGNAHTIFYDRDDTMNVILQQGDFNHRINEITVFDMQRDTIVIEAEDMGLTKRYVLDENGLLEVTLSAQSDHGLEEKYPKGTIYKRGEIDLFHVLEDMRDVQEVDGKWYIRSGKGGKEQFAIVSPDGLVGYSFDPEQAIKPGAKESVEPQVISCFNKYDSGKHIKYSLVFPQVD